MYSVLLVDDEPLILSGIKFLLDWEQHGCAIADTARNGQTALEKIRALQPDIVLCDINMPILSGMDLLQAAAQEFPQTVFIMLTNLQDFDLAQTALRYRAVDYVLKSQLEPEALLAALESAKRECDNRSRLAKAARTDRMQQVDEVQLLRDAFLHAEKAPSPTDTPPQAVAAALGRPYGALYLTVDYAGVPNHAQRTDEDFAELFAWQKDMTQSLAQTYFGRFTLFEPDTTHESLVLLCREQEAAHWGETVRRFYTKLDSACQKITQAAPYLLASDCFEGVHRLAECREQLFALRDVYYMQPQPLLLARELAPPEYQPLGLSGIAGRLAEELRGKNPVGCETVLTRAIERVRATVHEKSQGVWLCGELYGKAAAALKELLPADRLIPFFENTAHTHRQIARLRTRAEVADFLEQLRGFVVSSVEHLSQNRSDFLEKAKQYVDDHIESRILLSDVADYVSISPAYLSSLYKKMYGQNFVDYINSRKMERACEMLRVGDRRIYEISYQLGFENAYYFTRVFKRFVGMKPTDYQRKVRLGAQEDTQAAPPEEP